jgi:hypothetical protein
MGRALPLKPHSTMIYDTDRLKRIHLLLDSPVFKNGSPDDGSWKVVFAELIILVNDMLTQADQSGHRIDFWEGVGVKGKIQDITSLVLWLRTCLPDTLIDFTTRFDQGRLNRYFGLGTGYFSNGAFFTCEKDNDLAFFLDDQRIYLNRQIGRAVAETEMPIQATN